MLAERSTDQTVQPRGDWAAGMRRHGRRNNLRRRVLLGLGLFIAVALGLAAISNLLLPSASQSTERLSDAEKARLGEVVQLKTARGDVLWPGWGRADIPLIVYNEQYAFLTGYPDPPSGWVKVPQNLLRGGPWQQVPDDNIDGQAYYRQPLPATGVTPQAFTVLVGQRWVASLTTREWMRIKLGNEISQSLPGPLAVVVPYRLAGRVLAGNSDQYISMVLHESFHAYQGMAAPGRLQQAENASSQQEQRYPWTSQSLRESWQHELDLLADSAGATSDEQARQLARAFLAQRATRRDAAGLAPELRDYERQREWLEGLAKYSELAIWRLASSDPGYSPSSAILSDGDFKAYSTFAERWSQEVDQARRMAGDEGDGRFYYSGMLQATLLDRLMPDWKSRILTPGVWLEDLLGAAVD